MPNVSVAEAAKQLNVSVQRVHQRIAEGSLRAERLGSQWVVDELSVLRLAERKEPGRPLSARSAWAIIALAEGDQGAREQLSPAERSRAQARLAGLLSSVAGAAQSERDVRRVASQLRLMFRNRAERVSLKASAADIPKLREDPRWASLLHSEASGIALSDVDGYLAPHDVEAVSRAYLLVPGHDDANVIVHVLPERQRAYPDSKLVLALDLADRRGPREELRATQLLHEVADERGVGER